MKTQLLKFNGGGKVLYTRVRGIQGVHIYFDFAAGSFNDPKGKLGLSHFCEHVLGGFPTTYFTREERWSKARMFQGFNAATSRNSMRFFVYTVGQHFMEALDFLTDPFANLIIDKNDFEKERQIIFDEIATLFKSNGREAGYAYNRDAVRQANINRQTASPAGTVESVSRITINDVKKFIDKYFRLNNLIITIAGNVSKKEVVKGIKKYILPRIKEGGEVGFLPRELKKDIVLPAKMIFGDCVEKGKSYIEFNYKIDFKPFTGKIEDSDYCRGILTSCLRENMFEKLRLDKGLCYECCSVIKRTLRVRRLEDIIECAAEKFDKVIETYLSYLESLPENLDRKQFEKFKQKICECENYDVDKLFQIAEGSVAAYDCFKMIDYLKVKKYDLHRYSTVSYEEVNTLYKSLFKNLPQIIIISEDEKYKTKEFEKEIYSKIKEIINKKNKNK